MNFLGEFHDRISVPLEDCILISFLLQAPPKPAKREKKQTKKENKKKGSPKKKQSASKKAKIKMSMMITFNNN